MTRGDLPPTLLLHGPDDAMVGLRAQPSPLGAALRAHAVPVVVALPWMQHGGDVIAVGPSAWCVFRAVAAAVGRVSPEALTVT